MGMIKVYDRSLIQKLLSLVINITKLFDLLRGAFNM